MKDFWRNILYSSIVAVGFILAINIMLISVYASQKYIWVLI